MTVRSQRVPFGLYSFSIWGAVLPLFFAISCSRPPNAFNRRGGDIAVRARGPWFECKKSHWLALDQISGGKVDARQFQSLAQNLIRRFRMEAFTSPKICPKGNLFNGWKISNANAYAADKPRTDTRQWKWTQANDEAEANLLQMLYANKLSWKP